MPWLPSQGRAPSHRWRSHRRMYWAITPREQPASRAVPSTLTPAPSRGLITHYVQMGTQNACFGGLHSHLGNTLAWVRKEHRHGTLAAQR